MLDAEIMVLVCGGLHPKSHRKQRALNDARAVEMALTLSTPEQIKLVHAGDPKQDYLRFYLGMGVANLVVLDLPDGADPLAALVDYLKKQQPRIVLTGIQAQGSEGSGFLPYAIAASLKYTMVANACEIKVDKNAECVRILQGRPYGQRQILRAPLPVVVTVGDAANSPRQSTFAAARRGNVHTISVSATSDRVAAGWRQVPARPRPMKRRGIASESAEQRLQAAITLTSRTGGRVVEGLSADEAAAVILDYLSNDAGVWRLDSVD